ncbi:MAG: nucleotidyltransferase [Oscillospiraceae bacterium]|nr:nucleotidyltransferase [Oscillospiraceae bacterium]
MKVVGIICEYNPLHNGHIYHINETKRLIGEDTAVVCAMSGNFVQRGETAVFSKFARAKAAVKCGADLVIELPLETSLSSAEGFARGGVKLLDALGVCTHLSFGSEEGDAGKLEKIAKALLVPEMDELIKKELESGVSYAAARQKALRRVLGETADIIEKPNNILGIEYLKALEIIHSDMQPVTVSRFGGDHDGETGYSASAVRAGLLEGCADWSTVPEKAAEVFKKEIEEGRGPAFTKNIETAMLYRLRTMTEDEYDTLPFASEGLGQRLKKSVISSATLDEILEKTKTKRYAMSRIRRMIMCAYLGVTAEDMNTSPAYIRVLAATEKGRELLKKMRKTAKLPVITKPAAAKDHLNGKDSDLYTLAYPNSTQRLCGTDFTTSPYMEK